MKLRTALPKGAWQGRLARLAQWACGAIVGHDWRAAAAGEARIRRDGYRDQRAPYAEVRCCARCYRVERLNRALGRFEERR